MYNMENDMEKKGKTSRGGGMGMERGKGGEVREGVDPPSQSRGCTCCTHT